MDRSSKSLVYDYNTNKLREYELLDKFKPDLVNMYNIGVNVDCKGDKQCEQIHKETRLPLKDVPLSEDSSGSNNCCCDKKCLGVKDLCHGCNLDKIKTQSIPDGKTNITNVIKKSEEENKKDEEANKAQQTEKQDKNDGGNGGNGGNNNRGNNNGGNNNGGNNNGGNNNGGNNNGGNNNGGNNNGGNNNGGGENGNPDNSNNGPSIGPDPDVDSIGTGHYDKDGNAVPDVPTLTYNKYQRELYSMSTSDNTFCNKDGRCFVYDKKGHHFQFNIKMNPLLKKKKKKNSVKISLNMNPNKVFNHKDWVTVDNSTKTQVRCTNVDCDFKLNNVQYTITFDEVMKSIARANQTKITHSRCEMDKCTVYFTNFTKKDITYKEMVDMMFTQLEKRRLRNKLQNFEDYLADVYTGMKHKDMQGYQEGRRGFFRNEMAQIMDSTLVDMSVDRKDYFQNQLYDIKTSVQKLNTAMDSKVKKSQTFLDSIDEYFYFCKWLHSKPQDKRFKMLKKNQFSKLNLDKKQCKHFSSSSQLNRNKQKKVKSISTFSDSEGIDGVLAKLKKRDKSLPTVLNDSENDVNVDKNDQQSIIDDNQNIARMNDSFYGYFRFKNSIKHKKNNSKLKFYSKTGSKVKSKTKNKTEIIDILNLFGSSYHSTDSDNNDDNDKDKKVTLNEYYNQKDKKSIEKVKLNDNNNGISNYTNCDDINNYVNDYYDETLLKNSNLQIKIKETIDNKELEFNLQVLKEKNIYIDHLLTFLNQQKSNCNSNVKEQLIEKLSYLYKQINSNIDFLYDKIFGVDQLEKI